MPTKKRYSSYTYGEATTGNGKSVSFTCGTENGTAEMVRTFLKEHVISIDSPVTHKTKVGHGGGCGYSRYDIEQHRYAAGQTAFIEAIEVKDAPEGKVPFILHEYSGYSGSQFSEWQTRDDLIEAFAGNWSGGEKEEGHFKKLRGFVRLVPCGALRPWFYAIGDEVVIGDYAIASGLEDDPVFRLGQRLVVRNDKGKHAFKTCMGCRFIEQRQEHHPYATEEWRIVYLEDGTTLRICKDDTVSNSGWWSSEGGRYARPVQEGEAWIVDAMESFLKLLDGGSEGFQLKFADGRTFTGKISAKGKAMPTTEGSYDLVVTLGNGETREGWVTCFVPAPECPDILRYIEQTYGADKIAKYGGIKKIKVRQMKPKKGGKKWSGVFYASLPPKVAH